MALGIIFRHDCVILDACCIINLCESGHVEDVLESIPKSVMVAAYVYEEEIIRYNLKPMIERRLLSIAEVESEAEEISLVNYAFAIGDDGEAATGAIAVHRGWAIATDDKKAINVFSIDAPSIQLISTPDLMNHWAEIAGPTRETVRIALEKIQTAGHYVPPKGHPLRNWWQGMKSQI